MNREVEAIIRYFATSLFRSNNVEEILWDIAKHCISRLEFADCVIYLMNDDKTALIQKAAYGPKNPKEFDIHEPIVIPLGEGIVGSVALTGEPEIISDTSKDPRYIVDDAVRHSEITVPLVYQDEVIGVIDSEHPQKNFFNPFHLRILRIIAALASNKIAGVQAEEEQRKAEEAQRHAEKLKEIDQLKSRFFANISHEFRTPLTLILGPVKEMEEGRFTGDPKSAYRMIRRHGEQLLHLVNQLLDLSKLEAGKMKLQAKKTDLTSFLEPVTASYDSLAAAKKIHFDLDLAEAFIPVYVDSDKLEKILHNLLSNAFKFTGEGGEISLRVATTVKKDSPACAEPAPQSFNEGEATEARQYVQIDVKDTGQGIAPDKLANIFNRFYQAGSSHTHKREGTGIGLALVRELTELHKGTVSVTSTDGEGSCFTVLLPMGKAHLSEQEIVSGEPDLHKDLLGFSHRDPCPGQNPGGLPSPSPESQLSDQPAATATDADAPRLLIVEDHTEMRQFICRTLCSGYHLLEASDGLKGWEKAVDFLPDLVVSDVMMPEIDGLDLCGKLKSDERTSHIPVILLTAKADKTDRIKGLETGADDYLAKPFDADELRILIKNRIDQRNRLRERFSSEITLQPEDIAITSADERFLRQAREVVEKQMHDFDFNVEAFVEQMPLEHTQVGRKLKALTGQTPFQFIRLMRLKRAAQRIIRREDNISQIAYSVGFKNLSWFAKCFKEQFGQNPSEYGS